MTQTVGDSINLNTSQQKTLTHFTPLARRMNTLLRAAGFSFQGKNHEDSFALPTHGCPKKTRAVKSWRKRYESIKQLWCASSSLFSSIILVRNHTWVGPFFRPTPAESNCEETYLGTKLILWVMAPGTWWTRAPGFDHPHGKPRRLNHQSLEQLEWI